MKFIIRVDASRWIGSGHVMRCLVLADGLKKAGHQVIFICRPQLGDFVDIIVRRGHQLITLPALETNMIPVHSADYAAWLQVPWQTDAAQVSQCVAEAEWIVVDHYGIDVQWERQVKQKLNCKLFAIDDLVRPHAADLILDQTLGRHAAEYLKVVECGDKPPVVLSGINFALLSPIFRDVRKNGLQRSRTIHRPRILLSFGGIDEPNITLSVLKVLTGCDASLTVLLSPRAPHYAAVKTWCDRHANITHHDFVYDMANLMQQHDMAIGAPGTTSWERACVGLPNIVIPIADNQQAICRALLQHNATIVVQASQVESELVPAVQRVLNNYDTFSQANLRLCDGEGVGRVMAAITSNSIEMAFKLKPVTINDAALIYEWQSDPATRRYALNPAIPSWAEHLCWMEQKLQRQQDYFFVITHLPTDEPYGVIRLDEESAGHYLISIYIAPHQHGKGIGLIGLRLVDQLLPSVHIHATVLAANIASQRLFTKAGYQQVSAEKFVREQLWT